MTHRLEQEISYKEQGNILFRQREYKKAIEQYNAAINIKPDFKEAWLNKGICQKRLQQHLQAIESFNRAIEIDSQYTKALFQKESCLEQISAQVFFGIVDLKFTENGEVKILEMGQGLNSGFGGYNQLYDIPMHQKFGEKLKELGLPFFIALQHRDLPFSKVEGNLEAKLTSLPKKPNFDYENFSTYSGIYGAITVPATGDHILRLGRSITCGLASENKLLLHHMFEVADLIDHRPTTRIYSHNDDLNKVIDEINKTFPSSFLIIKAPDLNGGRGVKILEKRDLALQLPNILSYFKKMMGSNSPLFIVESYEASKTIKVEGGSYDPTMRVAYVIVRDKGEVRCHPLGAYWKLPPSQLSGNMNSLREQHISSYSARHRHSQKVSESDYTAVTQKLNQILEILFKSMFIFDHERYTQSLLNAGNRNGQRNYGHFLQSLRANTYARHGCFQLAHADLDQIIQRAPDGHKGYHERGMVFFRERRHQEALVAYRTAEEKEPGVLQTSIRSAQVLVFLKDYKQARLVLNNPMLSLANNSDLVSTLSAYMDGNFSHRTPLFFNLINLIEYSIPRPSHAPEIIKKKVINFLREQGGESIVILPTFLKVRLLSMLLTKELRELLSLDRVMIPLRNIQGKVSLIEEIDGITIEDSANKSNQPRLLLTFPNKAGNREKISQIAENKSYDLETEEKEISDVRAAPSFFQPASSDEPEPGSSTKPHEQPFTQSLSG